MNLKRFGVIATTAIISASLSACGVGEAKVADPAEIAAAMALPVEVSTPQIADIFATYQTTTTITSDSEAPVLARVSGEVVEILVEEGDEVEAGQVLARLDGDRLRLQMLQAKANLEKTSKAYERYVQLHERGLVSASIFEGLKFDMDALNASYELKQLSYSYTTIRAPISGVVSSRDIKLGQHLMAGASAFKITDTSKLIAYLLIPQVELSKISAGDTARVRVDAMPEVEFAATIARISPMIDPLNGTFKATATIENQDGHLAPGMFGRFNVAYEKHSGALLIPAAAVIEEDNETVVYVVNDGSANRRAIEVGIESDGLVEVLGGLEADEKIVITGQGGLRDGAKVLASNKLPTSFTG
ncbi:MAG: efflux RND transporter periplasmic adaptor subunit [Woeseiaceae bacterium]|nr:efflux RND transporter periplasmic adaptor subunit [Woeseiaceae bacterium]